MNDSIFIAGLDLGQVSDPTALAILERPRIRSLSDPPPVYAVRHLQRFPLGTSYPAIASDVQNILTRPPLNQSMVFLAVDKTGVGAAVCDLIRPVFHGLAAVTITGGQEASVGPAGFNVPKRELAGLLQSLLQCRRLLIAQGLPAAELLKHELQNFKVKINVATGNDSFEAWREKDHDDLVLAVALAIWLGEVIANTEREAAEEAAEAEMLRYVQAGHDGTVMRHLFL
jgi:hypothetical protein